MAKKRSEKKSETLEVRLPHSKKEAFMAACEREGITASYAMRTFIDAYLKRSGRVKLKQITQEITMKLFQNPLKTAGIAGTGIIAAILFSASPSMAEDDLFTFLDSNGDGFLTGDETSLLTDLRAQTEFALTQIELPEEYEAGDIVSVQMINFADYDTNGDGRFSKAEFAAIHGISFVFDGKVDGRDLNLDEDTPMTVTFFAPKGVELQDEDTYREILKSGSITFQSTEPGKEVFTINTHIKPGQSGNENLPE